MGPRARLGLGLGLAAALGSCGWLAVQPDMPLSDLVYPSLGAVAEAVDALPGAPEAERERRLGRLLERLWWPDKQEQALVWDAALQRLIDYYRATHDPALLAALDARRIDGHYGEELCWVYRQLSTEPAFAERYRAVPDAARRLGRCRGIEFSDAEIEALAGPRR